MINYDDYKKFFDLIKTSKNILIINSKPDGDSLGSSLALNLFLKKKEKNVTSISPTQIPDYLNFIAQKGEISFCDLKSLNLANYDLIILVDFSDFKRFAGEQGKAFTKIICIDHHKTQSKNGLELALIDTEAESTCGIITDIFIEYKAETGEDFIDKDIAFLLYCGLVSDTDSFGYANVTQDSFERAAYLMQYKFDKTEIILKFRESLSLKAFKFIQKNLSRVIINEEGRYAYLKIKKSDLTPDDDLISVNEASNFLNRALIRIIDNIDFSFVIKEINDQKSSISMRLHNNGNSVDLSKIAEKLGGGGHRQAAGGQIEMNVDEVEKEILNLLAN